MAESDEVRETARAYANPTVEAVLADLVDRVVRSADPERIVLFGSAADGRWSGHSDLDVLVVKAGRYRKLALLQEMRRALRGFPLPVDLLVATPDDLERFGDRIGLVYREALLNGWEIYAA